MVWVEDVETGKRRTMTLVAAKREAGIEYDAEQAYMGVVYYGQNAKTRQWGEVSLYGGMLAENAVQAISRDVFADAMSRVESAGYDIVLHVHDEIVSEVTGRETWPSEGVFNALMSVVPAWATGFPIVAAGWRGERYRK
jgi:DNA polymerase